VIGYIGRITERDVERIEEAGNAANYRGTDHIGKAGLEQSYEHELHGTTGFEQVEVNAGGRAVRALSHTRRRRATISS
jgi:penicillin-binding protein 2